MPLLGPLEGLSAGRRFCNGMDEYGCVEDFTVNHLLKNKGIALNMDEIIDSPYHPFKTKKAKEEYLKLYDGRAKKWPVPSTTKMVNTSYGKTFVRILIRP